MPLPHRALILAALLLLAACSSPSPNRSSAEPSPPPTPHRPHLILISIDTLRADRLGCYGYAPARTPTIDALAQAGVRFEDVTSPAPITAPSHASLLTGHYPPEHGVRSNGFFQLEESFRTLAEVLRDEGYDTAAVVGGFPLDSRFGFAQGFTTFDDHWSDSGAAEPERSAREVADRAIELVAGWTPERPSFLFVHFYDPHADYRPPADFAELDPYDGEIAYVDRELGRVLAAVDDRIPASGSMVVLTSDHGESLGEHGETTHAVFVYQSTLHVPLIIRGPTPPGLEAKVPVSLIDVVPTVLELLHVAPLDGVTGRSLAPLLSDASGLEPAPLYFESLLPRVEFQWAPLRGVRLGPHKLIDAPRPELFDLRADPGESQNLWPDDDGARLQRELEALAHTHWPEGDHSSPRSLRPEDREMLESLGYLQGAPGSVDPDELPDPKDRIGTLQRMMEGLTAYRQGRYAESESSYRVALEQDPENAVLRRNLARAVAAQDRPREADGLFAEAVRRAGPELQADILKEKAALALESGRVEEAESDARRAVELAPDSPGARLVLGRALTRRGDATAGWEILSALGRERPSDAAVLLARAENRIRAGESEAARRLLSQLLASDPSHGRARYDLGVLLMQEGNANAAVDHLRQAHQLLPDERNVALQLARALAALGGWEEGADVLQSLSERHPDEPEILLDLGQLLSRSGRHPEAVETLTRLTRLRPEDASAWNALGVAQARLERFAEALRCFQRATDLAPDRADYRDNLATARRALAEVGTTR